MSQFYQNSIFWIDVDKIKPNPFQPRREFDEAQLQSLADSIRQYGVLQALVVTRKEFEKPDGGMAVEYELIAGERRLRASKIAGLAQVPVLIKQGDETDLMKLELAIIENLQREDLNVVDRALAFKKLADEFGFKHTAIAAKIGKSREYVSNTIRILMLPEDIIGALKEGKITEGHTRPLLMLIDRPEEQTTLFKEIMLRKMSVRDTEKVARRIAFDKARKTEESLDFRTREIEDKLAESLGTRVIIEKKAETDGGKITISFFSEKDLYNILKIVNEGSSHITEPQKVSDTGQNPEEKIVVQTENKIENTEESPDKEEIIDDRSNDEVKMAEETESDDDLYSLKNFSI
jgi:ParB family chromosome partitioning protein